MQGPRGRQGRERATQVRAASPGSRWIDPHHSRAEAQEYITPLPLGSLRAQAPRHANEFVPSTANLDDHSTANLDNHRTKKGARGHSPFQGRRLL